VPPGPASGGPTVRSARHGDLPTLVALLEGGSLVPGKEDPDDPGAYEAAFAEIASGGDGGLLVAEVDGRVVGMCQLLVFRHLQARGGRCAEIESLHVDAAWRGRGIGGQLVETAVERARAAGCYRVQLTSNRARSDAHRFYERHGFVPSHVGYKRTLE